MEFIDLKIQRQKIQELLDGNIRKVLNHGSYIMGPEVEELELKLAAYVGVKHAIGCASGTDALLIALMACGVGSGDAVFTTPFTFIATAEVISLLGATPVFVDIDPRTFNIDPVKLVLAIKALKSNDSSIYPLPTISSFLAGKGKDERGNLRPRGIIPVDLFGLPAEHDNIAVIAKEQELFIIEDAAQSFGAKHNDRMSCSFGDIACTSFFPAKPLGCYGDGGMCFTDDDGLAEVIESIRAHGKGGHKYDNVRIGINGRLDTLQAAILLAKFDIFPEEIELRQSVAQRYTSFLTPNDLLLTPYIPTGYSSIWAQYSLLARNEGHRTALLKELQNNWIPSAIYYPKPLHVQSAFSHLGYKKGDFPISEDRATRIFSLPMHPYLTEDEQEKISKILGKGLQT